MTWSLDDFGTGYSSLSFLHQLQVNTVKVDRSFVSAIGADGSGTAMVRAIVGLAHALGMDVVAEGVETAEQAAELRALGCEYAQGFYFSRAVDHDRRRPADRVAAVAAGARSRTSCSNASHSRADASRIRSPFVPAVGKRPGFPPVRNGAILASAVADAHLPVMTCARPSGCSGRAPVSRRPAS